VLVRKTSARLDKDQPERVARSTREEGCSQAEIVRETAASYRSRSFQDRNFALAGSGQGDGSLITEVPEEDLLEGFGE
jgi:hypothetical protein